MAHPLTNGFHVLPKNDAREHVCAMDCECNPQATRLQDGIVPWIVHNPFDGRKPLEWQDHVEEFEAMEKRSHEPLN